MSFKKLIASVFLTTSLYFLTVVGFQLFYFKFSQHTWSDFYIVGLIISVCVAAFIGFKKTDNEPKISSYELLAYVVLFQIQIAVRISEIKFPGTASLWLDELSQAFHSQKGIFSQASAYEHQPPLAYMSEQFVTALFGYTEFAIRLTSAVFSALAGTLAFILFRYITKTYIASLALFLLLITFQMFYQYSIEARPVMLGVYFSLLYMAQISISLNDKNFNYPALVATGLIFLCSLGFQPPLMLSSLFAVFVLAAVFDRKYFKFLYSIALSILLFLPVQATIIKTSTAKIRQNVFASLVEKFEINNFLSWTENFGWYLIIGAALVAISLGIYFYRKTRPAFKDIIFFSAAAIFLLGGSYFFKTSIDYPLQRHYLFLSIPLILTGAAYSYASVKDYLSNTLKAALLLALIVFIYKSPIKESASFAYSNNFIVRDNFKDPYKFISETANEQDYLVQINLPINFYSPTYKFAGSEVYMSHLDPLKSVQYASSESTGLHNWLYEMLKRPYEPRRLYVFYSKNWNEVKVDFEVFKKNKNYYFSSDSSYVLIQIDNTSKDWKKQWFDLLSYIGKNEKSTQSWVYNIYRIHQALIIKDKTLFKNSFQQLAVNAKLTTDEYYSQQIKETVKKIEPDIEKTFGAVFLKNLPQI